MLMTSFVLMVVPLETDFDSYDYNKSNPFLNMYSLYSWMEIITVFLFTMQWLEGFVMLLAVTNISPRLISLYLNIHTQSGSFIFV